MTLNVLEEFMECILGEHMVYFETRSASNTVKFTVELEKIKKLYEANKIFDKIYNLLDWKEVTKTLGDVKGIVSTEDRQLLKIVHSLSDEDVDKMISEYQNQYKLYLKNSKMYGKEKWR